MPLGALSINTKMRDRRDSGADVAGEKKPRKQEDQSDSSDDDADDDDVYTYKILKDQALRLRLAAAFSDMVDGVGGMQACELMAVDEVFLFDMMQNATKADLDYLETLVVKECEAYKETNWCKIESEIWKEINGETGPTSLANTPIALRKEYYDSVLKYVVVTEQLHLDAYMRLAKVDDIKPSYDRRPCGECTYCLETMYWPMHGVNAGLHDDNVAVWCTNCGHATRCVSCERDDDKYFEKELQLLFASEQKSDMRGVATHISELQREGQCPLCRAQRSVSDEVDTNRMRSRAAKGDVDAQLELGEKLVLNSTDVSEGKYWLEAALREGNTMANFGLAVMHEDENQVDEAKRCYRILAKQGYPYAQFRLALLISKENGEAQCDESIMWLKLAAAQHHFLAAKSLATFYGSRSLERIPADPKSAAQALFWAMKIAKGGEAPWVLGIALQQFTMTTMGTIDATGFSAIPMSLYWLRKDLETGASSSCDTEHIKNRIKNIEDEYAHNKCGNCCKEAKPGRKLMTCKRCHSICYCSKDCQIEHWYKGHKKDCVSNRKTPQEVVSMIYSEGNI